MAAPAFPILFVAPERVDDAILASGLLKRLVDEMPRASFVVAAGPEVETLFADLPGLERTLLFEPRSLGLHWWTLWKRARGRRWGLVLDLRGSRLGRLLQARRRAIAKPLNAALDPVHKVLQAARVLGIDDDPPSPFLFTGPDTEAKADVLLKTKSRQAAAPILAIAPGADWVGKTWPAERFAQVCAELLGADGPLANGRLMLVGGSEDRRAAEALGRVVGRDRMIDLVGKTDLLTAYACLKRADLFVGNETPFLHLAAAAGVPTVGLLGPSDERLYAPWGDKARTVRGARSFGQLRALDPTFSQAVSHMQDVTTAKVVAAARDLLAHALPEPAPPTDEEDHG